MLTVVGWEVMGWCSYLLIGHWSRRHSARRAAHKAFLVTRRRRHRVRARHHRPGRRGRTPTSLGIVVATWARPTACIDSLVADGSAVGDALTACNAPDATLRAVFLTLVVIGVLGKSAQVPFQDWLADAMEGPTPASALIHAATMVAAGTVVLAGFFPLLSVSQTPRWVLGIAVSVTMLLAAVLAFAQSDLKRLLAWSTVSQVGVMLSALAAAPPVAGPDAGLFHLWSHAIFKALLFLDDRLGWRGRRGTAAKALRGSALAAPLLRVSFLFGLLSLAGVPLVVGGLSKEHVVAVSWEGAVESGPGVIVLVALIVTAAVTAAYCTRAYLILTAHVRPSPASAPITLAVQGVLAVLVGLSVVGGLVLLTDAFRVGSTSLVWVLVTVLAIVVGVVVALRGGFDRDPAQVLVPRLIPHADRGLGVDALYLRLVATPRARAGPPRRLPRHRGHRRLRARHRRRDPGGRAGPAAAPSAVSGPAPPSASSSGPSWCSASQGCWRGREPAPPRPRRRRFCPRHRSAARWPPTARGSPRPLAAGLTLVLAVAVVHRPARGRPGVAARARRALVVRRRRHRRAAGAAHLAHRGRWWRPTRGSTCPRVAPRRPSSAACSSSRPARSPPSPPGMPCSSSSPSSWSWCRCGC